MIIVQLVPKLLARKRRKSTPTQGQDANRYLSCLYKKESQLIISVSTKRYYIIFKTLAHDAWLISCCHRPVRKLLYHRVSSSVFSQENLGFLTRNKKKILQEKGKNTPNPAYIENVTDLRNFNVYLFRSVYKYPRWSS